MKTLLIALMPVLLTAQVVTRAPVNSSSGGFTAPYLYSGSPNFVIAFGAGAGNVGGNYTNAMGQHAAGSNTGNNVNVMGDLAAQFNTGTAVEGLGDTVVQSNTGSFVQALGVAAARHNSGSSVTAIGTGAAQHNAGNFIVAIGGSSNLDTNTGDGVVAIGEGSLTDKTTGDNVVAITPNNGVLLGTQKGLSSSVVIGTDAWTANSGGTPLTNVVAINGQFTGSNQTTIGNSGTQLATIFGKPVFPQAFSTPASSTDSCTRGTILFDDSYAYFCVATNTWMRTTLSAF